jgi:hypothetical protein
MKLTIRIVALTVVLAGAAAASISSSNSHITPSHLAVSAAMPGPVCTPSLPTCQQPKAIGN